jgi:thiamine monophosphate synthase
MATGALVGCSCHDAAGVVQRTSEGADYVLLGPLGEVPGKPAFSPDAFRTIASAALVPIVALGGIASRKDADRAMALGASAIAVQRALVDASGPAWIAAWLAARA